MVSVRRSELAAGLAGAAVGVRIGAAPVVLEVPADRAELEAEMAAAVRLSWRLPGGIGSGFASDGPWHLITHDAGDYDARGGDLAEMRPPRIPLDVEDMARIDRLAVWLTLLRTRARRRRATGEDVADGAIVAAVMRQKASGRAQVDWDRVLKAVGLRRGKGQMAMRYDRAMEWLAGRVAQNSENQL